MFKYSVSFLLRLLHDDPILRSDYAADIQLGGVLEHPKSNTPSLSSCEIGEYKLPCTRRSLKIDLIYAKVANKNIVNIQVVPTRRTGMDSWFKHWKIRSEGAVLSLWKVRFFQRQMLTLRCQVHCERKRSLKLHRTKTTLGFADLTITK